ncbi:MAG: undecaprenyl-diphosphate phosphatase [Actinomycetia bacterium]|nr:undecaprenyl-diphosphate phosphatase [Actinomycetes bacterium]
MGRVPTYTVAAAALLVAVALAAAGIAERPDALSDWQAFALGIVQGLTELLPISSSGHLIIVPWLADWEFLHENEAFNDAFDVALHLGTALAVVVFFASDLGRLTHAWLTTLAERRIETADQRLAWFIVIATLPALVVGGLFGGAIGSHLGEPWQIAVFLAVFGIVLLLADRLPANRAFADLDIRIAGAVGLVQCLALMPGVSRSGITISAGRALGLERPAAARFSFLLLVPVSVAAVAYTAVNDLILGELPPGWVGPFLVGTIAAFGSGLIAIRLLLGVVQRHSLTGFVIYRLIAALVILLLIASGARDAIF